MKSKVAYPSYRETGIPWLRQTPTHWKMRRLKNVVDIAFSSVDKHTYEGEQITFLCNYVDVYKNEIITRDLEFMQASATQDEIQNFCLKKDFVMITKDSESWDDIAVPAYVPCDFENVICGYHLALLKPKENLYGKYLFRALQAKPINYQFEVEATGITRYGIDQYAIGNTFFLLPSRPEQEAIANYLDRATTRIDALIAKKKRLLELLAEKRAALITHAVTHGLDPNVPMKESGVEWLGEIPEHWEVKPLFAFFQEKNMRNTGNKINKVLSLSYGNIIVRNVENNMGLLPESFDTYQIVKPGNIILRLTDLQNDKVSLRVGLVKELGIITSAYVCLHGKSGINPDFGYLLLHAYDLWKVFYTLGGGVRQTMRFEDLKHMPILIPPLEDQQAIFSNINGKTQRLLNLSSRLSDVINLLQDYRSALISAAVTGQIDARKAETQ